jgi:polyisoprenoid-binding protein YceI
VARYTIVPGRSLVSIEARSSLHPIHAETRGLEGWVGFDVTKGGRLDLSVTPGAQVTLAVSKLTSGKALEDRELQRRIDAKRHPTIDGALIAMAETGTVGRYRVRGDVTFRGVTRSYESEMTFAQLDDQTIRLEGRSTFDIRDFGMEPPRILLLRVHPEVDVRVEVVALRET